MTQTLTPQSLAGTYRPAAPGARTRHDADNPLRVDGKQVTVVVDGPTGRTANLFIGGSLHQVRELPAHFAGGDVNRWAQQVAAALPEPLQKLPAGLSYRMERVAGHGPSSRRELVAPGRYVVLVEGESPWATERPEECLNATGRGVWLGEVLVCLSCGLDCT